MIEEQEYDYELLSQVAYASWLARGKPEGSPEVDWTYARSQLGLHIPVSAEVLNREQLDVTDDA